MYEQFYGFTEKPFSILPDPSFLYWGREHSLAFAMLEYGIVNQAGFTVITGDIGSGKTTLVRYLLQRLDRHYTIALVNNTIPGSRLLDWVMMSLSQPIEASSYVALYRNFQDFLVREHVEGRRTVIIVDEAQNLSIADLEELRMLSNINADKEQLLQIILVGQPQLRDLLRRPELVQFAQRISSDYHLTALSKKEVPEYIAHRMQLAGSPSCLFSYNACMLVAEASHGIPRAINIICDTALVYAYSFGNKRINSHLMTAVLKDRAENSLLGPRYFQIASNE